MLRDPVEHANVSKTLISRSSGLQNVTIISSHHQSQPHPLPSLCESERGRRQTAAQRAAVCLRPSEDSPSQPSARDLRTVTIRHIVSVRRGRRSPSTPKRPHSCVAGPRFDANSLVWSLRRLPPSRFSLKCFPFEQCYKMYFSHSIFLENRIHQIPLF